MVSDAETRSESSRPTSTRRLTSGLSRGTEDEVSLVRRTLRSWPASQRRMYLAGWEAGPGTGGQDTSAVTRWDPASGVENLTSLHSWHN